MAASEVNRASEETRGERKRGLQQRLQKNEWTRSRAIQEKEYCSACLLLVDSEPLKNHQNSEEMTAC